MFAKRVRGEQVKEIQSSEATKIRTMFSRAMSDMYQKEVPLYGHMLGIVTKINLEVFLGIEKDNKGVPIRGRNPNSIGKKLQAAGLGKITTIIEKNNTTIEKILTNISDIKSKDPINQSELDKAIKAISDTIHNVLIPQISDAIKDNAATLNKHPKLRDALTDLKRTSEEKHGAIRVGTKEELGGIAKIFYIMGMYPTNYYDLRDSNLPIHSTASRPVTAEELGGNGNEFGNPFRIFTSLLIPGEIGGQKLANDASKILSTRKIFNHKPTGRNQPLEELLDIANKTGAFEDETKANEFRKEYGKAFVEEAIKIFQWHKEANVDKSTYESLKSSSKAGGLISDIVAFKGPHINHLTPNVYDIDALHARMIADGISCIEIIQGPPRRKVPILLRQTSFNALEEEVTFKDGRKGMHTARFGEIEQRGIALTIDGMSLYNKLMSKTIAKTTDFKITMNEEIASIDADKKLSKKDKEAAKTNAQQRYAAAYYPILESVFSAFPDNEKDLRENGLAVYTYELTDKKAPPNVFEGAKSKLSPQKKISLLIDGGYLRAIPVTYEDFLPVSAAGIFKSNLGKDTGIGEGHRTNEGKIDLEKAIRGSRASVQASKMLDNITIYEAQEAASFINICTKIPNLATPAEIEEKQKAVDSDPRRELPLSSIPQRPQNDTKPLITK